MNWTCRVTTMLGAAALLLLVGSNALGDSLAYGWATPLETRFVPNGRMFERSADPPLSASSFVLPSATHRPHVYLGDYTRGVVYIYDQATGREVGYVRTGHRRPWELAVDARANLYIGNGDGTITAYHRHDYELFRTLYQPHCCASGLALDPAGTLYATEYPTQWVDVFPPKAKTPQTTFRVANVVSVIFMASDSHGNIFVDGLSPSGKTIIDEITPPAYTVTTLQTLTAYPGGIAFDSAQNMIFSDQYGTLYTFAPPYTGPPTSSFFYEYGSGGSGGAYSSLALNEQENLLWAAADSACVDSYCAWAQSNTYPLQTIGPQSTRELYGDTTYGIAVDPPGAD